MRYFDSDQNNRLQTLHFQFRLKKGPFRPSKKILNKTIKINLIILGEEITGPLIKSTPPSKSSGGHRFVNHPMGVNFLYNIGKDVAKHLGLQDPQTYTGHTFRRSSVTAAVDKGISSKQLQRHYGWDTENTANRYIAASEEGARNVSKVFSNTSSTTTAVHTENGIEVYETVESSQEIIYEDSETGTSSSLVEVSCETQSTPVKNVFVKCGNNCTVNVGENYNITFI